MILKQKFILQSFSDGLQMYLVEFVNVNIFKGYFQMQEITINFIGRVLWIKLN
jgi:flagellar biosynthesis protein FliQ